MKLFHIADLHLGKKINERSLHDDQAYILNQILDYAQQEKIDGIIIAGDIYDRSIAPIESIKLFESFLERLNAQDISVYIIAGNHDSADRLAFGAQFLQKNDIYVAGSYNGSLLAIHHDAVSIYLLPFVRPHMVQPYFNKQLMSYHDGVKAIIDKETIHPDRINLLVSHQFVVSGTTEPERSDSETITVGGVDAVDSALFDCFDYVALGHVHRPQSIGRNSVRYAGSPLVYSQSECNQTKSITVLNVENKTLRVDTIALKPMRPVVVLKGRFEDLETHPYSESYVYVELEDSVEVVDGAARLRLRFPNLLSIRYAYFNNYSMHSESRDIAQIEDLSVEALFERFYLDQNKNEMNETQRSIIQDLLKEGSNASS